MGSAGCLYNTVFSSEWITTKIISITPQREFKKLCYTYEVNGELYRGERIGLSWRDRWTRKEIKKIIEEKNNGIVFYNPSNPEKSALKVGGNNVWNLLFFAGKLWLFLIF